MRLENSGICVGNIPEPHEVLPYNKKNRFSVHSEVNTLTSLVIITYLLGGSGLWDGGWDLRKA